MNGVSLEILRAAQAKNSTTATTATAAKTSSGKSFSGLLTEKISQLESTGATSPYAASAYTYRPSLSASSPVSNLLASTDTEDTDTEKETTQKLLLMMCMMMMSSLSSSSDDSSGGGMSTLMMSMLKSFAGTSGSSAVNTLITSPVSSPIAGSAKGSAIVQAALTRLGDPYSKSKRNSGNYVDCSSLAQWAYRQAGISIPSTSVQQAKYCYDNGFTITKDQLQPGDLVFWSNTASHDGRWRQIHHVAIYAGDGKIVEAKTSTKGVVYDDLWSGGNWKIAMYARPH